MQKRIAHYIRAGYACLEIISHEEGRVEAAMVDVVNGLNKSLPQNDPNHPQFELFTWSLTDGLVDVSKSSVVQAECGPIDVLDHFLKAGVNSVYLCRDFHLFVEDRNPMLWRKLRDAVQSGKANNKCFVILGCRLALPPELEKEVTVIDFTLPDRDELKRILSHLADGNGISKDRIDEESELLSAASGLTCFEAEQAFALSLVETGRITKSVVFREKCQAVRKNGMLEVVESKTTLTDIGGLENLKKWLLERKNAFTDEARAYKLPVPRGFLAVGQPGTGKTLTAKAVSSVLGVPCLRLDAAKLFGSLVGQSEANWRAVHATAKAMAPCVLHIDEVDGAMSGAGSSGQTDGGTTARVVKSILQDMQDNSEGIFYVLTANDIDNLPAPLLRRMDEVWNVELPTAAERELIWGIQIAKAGRDPKAYDLTSLAMAKPDVSGAEIEKLVQQTLYRAFAERREPSMDDFKSVAKDFVPLSQTMAADIEKRKKRLEGVSKLAGGEIKVVPPKPVRKIASVGKN